MKRIVCGSGHLRNLFQAVTEQTFQVELGIADPAVTDYLSQLLTQFLHTDSLPRLRELTDGLQDLVDVMEEAEQRAQQAAARLHRRIGDMALYWAGVYPEALDKFRRRNKAEGLVDLPQVGRRAYYLASLSPALPQRRVLRRLSDEFELCCRGLHQARQEWERISSG